MTECTQTALRLPGFSRRKIDVSFDGGDITGNGGAQLLRLADDRTRLIESARGRSAILGAGRAARTIWSRCCASGCTPSPWDTRI